MNNNKFNEFYSKKPVRELIEQLRDHRITGTILDKAWYEALVSHLSERELSDEDRKIVNHILSSEPEILKNDGSILEKSLDKETEFPKQETAWYHNWGAFMFTVAMAVALGTLVAAYIIYLALSTKVGKSF